MEKTKLPEPFRTDWINALKSGEYKQGKGALYVDGHFCCIGVGCSVKGASIEDLDGRSYWPLNQDFSVDLMQDEQEALVCLNDTKKKTFPEIADYIEQNH